MFFFFDASLISCSNIEQIYTTMHNDLSNYFLVLILSLVKYLPN